MRTRKIVPRWEWRSFAPSLPTIAQAVAIPSDVASRESDEIYLLGRSGTANVKIRDGVLDIKRLRQIDADGLELWEPVFKAHFPLGRSDLAAASAVWPLPLETLPRETYTIDQFIEEVISLRADLHVVRVHKSRRAFTFAGCIAELVRLTVELSNAGELLAGARRPEAHPRGVAHAWARRSCQYQLFARSQARARSHARDN